jgi:16S rRNA (guanine966-N2)-methyltransferase
MDNRRPPRANSSGRKPSFGRPRGAAPARDGHRDGAGPAHGSGATSRSYGTSGTRYGRSPENRWDGRSENRFNKTRGPAGGRPPGRDDRSRGRPTVRRQEPDLIKITSDSQITDGRFRGRTLLNSNSPKCAHASCQVREAIFKTIAKRVKAGRILDLGAGSGTIGIEAISRGAMLATFVERSARMCTYLRKNLEALGIKDGHGEVAEIEILPFLKRAAMRKRVWDLVYIDLLESDQRAATLDRISRGCAIRLRGLVIIVHSSDDDYQERLNHLKRWRTIDQGEKILTFYERI